MAHKFGRTGRQRSDQPYQIDSVKCAGQFEAREMIRRPAAVPLQNCVESRTQESQRAADNPSRNGYRSALQREIEWTPHPADIEFISQLRYRIENRRKQMRMFVCIEMRGLDSRCDNPFDLGAQLSVGIDAPRQDFAD